MCRQVYRREFSDGTDERLDELYDQLDSQHTNHVDFLTWSERVRMNAPLPVHLLCML